MSLTSALPRLTGRRSIRLLRIKPPEDSKTLECEVKAVEALEHVHEFDALSYVWGGKNQPETTIRLNNTEITVTRSLENILRHLGRCINTNSSSENLWDETHPLHSSHNVWRGFARNVQEHDLAFNPRSEWLWIDALCINQDDNAERSSQVQFMRDIYRSATTVRIWFGEEDPTPIPLNNFETASFAKIRHFGEFGSAPVLLVFIEQALRHHSTTLKRWASMPVSSMEPGWRNQLHGFLQPTAKEWAMPEKFFINAWFSRVWVIQEAAVSNIQNTVVMLGDWEIKWSAVGKASQWFEKNFYSNMQVQNASAIWNITLQESQCLPLLTLLSTFRNRGATDGRDRIYAMLGLAEETFTTLNEQTDQLLEINYDKLQQDVFRDAAACLLERYKNLSIFSHCEYSTENASNGYPSWVPVWSNPQSCNPFPFYTSFVDCPFNADLGKEMNIIISGKVIDLAGVSFDTVETCMEPFDAFRDSQMIYREERDHIATIWDATEHALRQENPNYVREQAFGTFLSVLTAGVDNTGKEAELVKDFQKNSRRWVRTYFRDCDSQMFFRNWGKGGGGPQEVSVFQNACARACTNRRIFVTRKGLIGLGPTQTQKGDCVIVLFGGKFPFILRRQADAYVLIGDCYVSRSMHGEIVKEWEENGSPNQTFKIV